MSATTIRRILAPAPLALAALLMAVLCVVRADADSTVGGFRTLAGIKTDVDLPAESSGSAASIQRTLRPALSYPTLHVHSPASMPPPDSFTT